MMTTQQQMELGARLLYFLDNTGTEDGSPVILRNSEGEQYVMMGSVVRDIAFTLIAQGGIKRLLGSRPFDD